MHIAHYHTQFRRHTPQEPAKKISHMYEPLGRETPTFFQVKKIGSKKIDGFSGTLQIIRFRLHHHFTLLLDDWDKAGLLAAFSLKGSVYPSKSLRFGAIFLVVSGDHVISLPSQERHSSDCDSHWPAEKA